MDVLERWLADVVTKPIDALNAIYVNEDGVIAELEQRDLPKTNGYTVASSHVSPETLCKLHEKLRGQPCELAIWDAVLWYLAHPLPILLAHDLLDRGISVVSMGMTRQVDEVQWRLATLVEDALFTLIRERYMLPRFSVGQFETMLEMYTRRYDGILYMLSFYETPSAEKRAVYEAALVSAEEDRREKLEDSES